ncbi:hypothetical protein KC878_01630 [Candidatus Saccharibacteria bacterium]|nr:hypothetical protein [Candidatus Saccharibacteria bacterium]MCB9821062.1 hypothetical protein [Candidatus Nomurabacteria bacterium]
MKQKSIWQILITSLAILLFLVAGASGYLYWRERSRSADLRLQIADLQSKIPLTPEEQAKQLLEKVSAIYEIPADEDPVIATIEDITKFKDQPFFDNAKNGDKLLIFNKAKWALLYRPETDKIINAGPTVETKTDAQQSSADPETNTDTPTN